MGLWAKVTFCVAAAVGGLIIGSWVTTMVVPVAETECVEVKPPGDDVIVNRTMRCTLDASDTHWRLLFGGLPGAGIAVGLMLAATRRYERRSIIDNANPS